MELVVIRHAIAEDREEFARTSPGASDDLRPLTDDGRQKMERNAAGLVKIAPTPNVIASSPLTRARETAVIVARAFGIRERAIEITDVLRPDSLYGDFLDWLESRGDAGTVAVIGHEPHLSGLVTWLLTGMEESRIELKKGAACLLELDGPPRAGDAMLKWALAPAQLRRLG